MAKHREPKRPPLPKPADRRDKPVKGWSRSTFAQAGRGRSGK
ncbi:MAG TPA: hypothetical protein VGJ32_10080 [Solirubrobacteraceae bacterium]